MASMARVIDAPRNVRSQRTRAALLGAMRALLEESGFESLTMAAVADRAGVSRRAVYLHFPSRTELVTALFDYVAELEGLDESLQRVWEAPDALSAVDEWARHLARYHPRVLAVDRAVDRVRRVDADAALHHAVVARRQQATVRTLVAWLEREGRLRPPWTVATATDMLWALTSTEVVERLMVDRNWSRKRFTEHVSMLLHATFAMPDEPYDLDPPVHTGTSAAGHSPTQPAVPSGT
jgi:AcrR family transcriptional regulator